MLILVLNIIKIPNQGKEGRKGTAGAGYRLAIFWIWSRYAKKFSGAPVQELNKKHIEWKIHKVQLGSSTHYERSEQ